MRSASYVLLAAAALAVVLPEAARAQAGEERQAWSVTPMVGVLRYDFTEKNHPFFAGRATHPVNEWMRLEFETSYARVEVQSDADGVYDPGAPEEKSSLVTGQVGVQIRYRTSYVEPYVGLSGGIFWRRDDNSELIRSSSSAISFPAGLRIFATDHFGLRAEVRLRRDSAAFGISTDTNFEFSGGISYTF